jgi:peptidoglycan/xylan/chitin deacetylase (PgdA/CDA1 family)
MREPVRATIELGVRERLSTATGGDGVRRLARVSLELFVYELDPFGAASGLRRRAGICRVLRRFVVRRKRRSGQCATHLGATLATNSSETLGLLVVHERRSASCKPKRATPMSRRARLARLLHLTGIVRAALALRSSVPIQLVNVLTYHRFPSATGERHFDDDVVDVSADSFERQLRCLKQHFTFVGVDELCALAAGRRLPPNALAITFDDGYLDNYEIALPILKRYDAKATFFLSTAAINERRVYWWDRIAYIVKRTPLSRITLSYPLKLELHLGDRALAQQRLLRIVKTFHGLDLERFLDELGVVARVAWSAQAERAFADRLIMTWDHVRELKRAGMDVQSHTRTHRVLATLEPGALVDELAGSRADVAREVGEAPRALAYPVGSEIARSSPIRAALDRAGYELGLSNGTGANLVDAKVDRFNIRRHAVGLDVSESYLLAMLTMPALAQKHPPPQGPGAREEAASERGKTWGRMPGS